VFYHIFPPNRTHSICALFLEDGWLLLKLSGTRIEHPGDDCEHQHRPMKWSV
jgi:hypothetical protein